MLLVHLRLPLFDLDANGDSILPVQALRREHALTFVPPGEFPPELHNGDRGEESVVKDAAQAAGIMHAQLEAIPDDVPGSALPPASDHGRDQSVACAGMLGVTHLLSS